MAFISMAAVLPAQTAGGATSVTIIRPAPSTFSEPSHGLGKCSVTSPSLVTGVATNNATFNFRQMRAGVSVGTVATLTLGLNTNLAAEVEVNVPITGSPSILDGDVLDVQLVQNGTGLALPAGIVAAVELE